MIERATGQEVAFSRVVVLHEYGYVLTPPPPDNIKAWVIICLGLKRQ
jgi:hypothetical protein